jgi:Tol biopolymer transport system component
VRAFPVGDTGYFQQGIWLIPAPLGGPPRKLLDRAGAMRWSADGKRIVYMRPDPASGDTILVARADGSQERVVVPRTQGLHVHDPAFSPDGAWVYYTRGLKSDEAPVEIWRVPSEGGAGERVVATLGLALSPQPTPDGSARAHPPPPRGRRRTSAPSPRRCA